MFNVRSVLKMSHWEQYFVFSTNQCSNCNPTHMERAHNFKTRLQNRKFQCNDVTTRKFTCASNRVMCEEEIREMCRLSHRESLMDVQNAPCRAFYTDADLESVINFLKFQKKEKIFYLYIFWFRSFWKISCPEDIYTYKGQHKTIFQHVTFSTNNQTMKITI